MKEGTYTIRITQMFHLYTVSSMCMSVVFTWLNAAGIYMSAKFDFTTIQN